MQISCEFASDFLEKPFHYCTTIASQKSCEKPANRIAASGEKPTPGLAIAGTEMSRIPPNVVPPDSPQGSRRKRECDCRVRCLE